MSEPLPLLAPDFRDLPPGVRAAQSTRLGGFSGPPWDSLNLALQVGDDPECVTRNRERLQHSLGLVVPMVWPRQIHGTRVVAAEDLESAWEQGRIVEADAVITNRPGQVCAVQTADCLPVVLSSSDGMAVGVAHAGWRGLSDGVLEAMVEALHLLHPAAELCAWMGAAIGPRAFEVGPEVREAFLDHDVGAGTAFRPGRDGRLLVDIYALARHRLGRVGVERVAGGGRCTYTESETFFSYRRDGTTGRMGTCVWIHPEDGGTYL